MIQLRSVQPHKSRTANLKRSFVIGHRNFAKQHRGNANGSQSTLHFPPFIPHREKKKNLRKKKQAKKTFENVSFVLASAARRHIHLLFCLVGQVKETVCLKDAVNRRCSGGPKCATSVHLKSRSSIISENETLRRRLRFPN